MTTNEKSKEITEKMQEIGLSLDKLIEYQLANDRSFLSMPLEVKSKFDKYLDGLQKKYNKTKEQGDVLENLASCLMFSEYDIFKLMKNIRTSSNEIDLLVTLSDKGKMIVPKLFSFLGEKFLCECKNYSSTLSVTYVGKFYSLLKATNSKIGILFTINGVTGINNWKDSKAFIRKVALKEDVAILVFEINDYKEIKENNIQFLDLVEKKYHSLMDDISYEQFISPHRAEKEFLNFSQ